MTAETKPQKLVTVGVLVAKALRDDAEAHRMLAAQLHRAILAADWKMVAEVRHELAQVALGLDGLAEKHDPPA